MNEGTRIKTVAFATLGCKMNRADTEASAAGFEAMGWRVVPFNENADAYVINTCTVTGATDHQSRQLVRRALRRKQENPSVKVVVTGCYAQTASAELATLAPGIDLIAGNLEKEKIVLLLENATGASAARIVVSDISQAAGFDHNPAPSFRGLTRAYLRIQDGCDSRCAYCIVPFARGPSRSLPPEAVLDRAKEIAIRGYSEIVLTGIHIGRYGLDLQPRSSLSRLLGSLCEIPNLQRLRLSSIEPGEFTRELIETIISLPKICPHFHIPLQSAAPEVLAAMKRPGSECEFERAADAIREFAPEAAIGADVMVGFPGETEAAFAQTRDFLERMKPAYIHIFRYSPRPGTVAASMDGQIPEEVKKCRSTELLKLRSCLSEQYRSGFTDRTLEVLFEHRRTAPDGLLTGLTGNYIRVSASGPESAMGKIRTVLLKHLTQTGIRGELVQPD